jgi:hypothetical protein
MRRAGSAAAWLFLVRKRGGGEGRAEQRRDCGRLEAARISKMKRNTSFVLCYDEQRQDRLGGEDADFAAVQHKDCC